MLIDIMFGTPIPDTASPSEYASDWRKPINKCENKWAISWIVRKNYRYMTRRSMASCLKQEILCGCFLLWSLVDVLKSSIVPGQDPSELSVD